MSYSIEETAKAAGLAPQTVRNWISAGVLPTPKNRVGRGVLTGLTAFDVLMIIVASELSHLGIGPKSFSPLVPKLAYCVSDMKKYIKGAEEGGYFIQAGKDPVPMADMVEQNRFFAVYYDPQAESGFNYTSAKPDEILSTVDTTKVVVDAFALAFKADEIMKSLSRIE